MPVGQHGVLFAKVSIQVFCLFFNHIRVFFVWLVKFIPRYFILFHVVVNEIVFLISLSDSLLLVYRISTDFSILTVSYN